MRLIIALLCVSLHAADPAIPSPPQPDVLYYLHPDGNRLLPLEQQTPGFRQVRSFAAADFQGVASPFRISSSRPTFVVRQTTPPDKNRAKLLLLDAINGKRTLMLTVGPDKIGIPLPGKDAELEYRPEGPDTYALRPLRPLASGEYALNFGRTNLAFLFGVEPGATAPDEPAEESRAVPAPADDKRRILDGLLQKKLITEADYKAKLAELSSPPAAPGPEERLRKLDGLLKRGLISQPEYQKKRAEILAEI